MRTVYTDPTKGQKEASFFQTFREQAAEIQTGEWIRGEAPDYRLNTSGRVYGLEITTLVKENRGAPLTAIRRSQNGCLRMVRAQLDRLGLLPVEVKVGFSDDRQAIRAEQVAAELTAFIVAKRTEIDDSKSWCFLEPGLQDIGKVIIRLHTFNGRSWLENNRVERLHLNWVLRDSIPLVQAAISKKEAKLDQYLLTCDECWLLLGVDEHSAPEAIDLSPIGLTHVFQSLFTRVFFVRNGEGRVYELRRSCNA
ncbi:MAG: hypothetical protein PHS14_05925 [Elusimicrobia bacterium]|nr:hypothetical protein [Elusimicrobiota bacterium]